MDITLLFKACIKTIKAKNRAFGQSPADTDKSRILISRNSKREFTTKSKEIIQQISKLYEFLAEHQQAYLNFFNHLSGFNKMSDSERDKIDAGAQRIINACSSSINDLQQDLSNSVENPNQVSEHQKVVISLMKNYLKQICNMYSEQRATRLKHSLEFKNLTNRNSKASAFTKDSNTVADSIVQNDENPISLEDESLSPEEVQMFELENKELYNELNSLAEEVKLIENKVVKIAELQEIFTEKVLEQDGYLDHVAGLVVGATENVKDANDQIRQAIQTNAGRRVWILFFLLLMSFSLLFLDWYND